MHHDAGAPGLTPDAYRQIPPKASALTTLDLGGCGRLHDEHLMAIVEAAPHLRALALGGPFLLSDHALQLAVRQLKHPLERFSISYCPRIGAGTLRALADRCHRSLQVLKVVGCDDVRDPDLAPLVALQSLTKLCIRECTQLTDGGLIPFLAAVGKGLVSLKLDGCTSLCDASTGQPNPVTQTLPVAVQTAPPPSVKQVRSSTADGADAGAAAAAAAALDATIPTTRSALLTVGLFAQLGQVLCPGTRLLRVNVAGTAFDDAALVALAEACPVLERLDLTRTLVTNTGVTALVAAQCAGRLTHLSLNRIAEDLAVDVLMVLAAVGRSLRRLDLSWMRNVDDDVVVALRRGCALEYLAVWGCNRLTEQALEVAQRAPPFALVGAFFVR